MSIQIVHQILTLYGTGANASHLQKGFDDNSGYQRPPMPSHQRVIEDLRTWDHASKYLGKEQYYPDFLAFFQREVSDKGWEAVVSEYLLSGTEAADDLLVRLHGGLIHPLIQLMFGMEWKQPALVAEALAQTCVHKDDLKELLYAAEENANEAYEEKGTSMPSIVSLLKETHGELGLAKVEGSNRLWDWMRKGAPDEALGIISKVKVMPEEVEEKTAEMFDAVVFAAAGATFHPTKLNKFNFYLMHFVNVSPFYLTINSQSWIPIKTKARLLEWKIRLDLFHYAAIGAPDLSLEQIKAYEPEDSATVSVAEILPRFHPMDDDGHAVKLARAAAICQENSKEYEDRDWMLIKGDDTWAKIHHLILDSVEGSGPKWVWCQGLDEAWKDIPDKPKL
ncbi:Oxidoreductase AflY [Cytospora mali]|uniref:Oxidoreductase AflY n=1 Tax=Cytospora mali TaxID=578113 RepID=A0A194UMB6_CYTMA|nr:Oxidoreductase AflY [Valsa mali var. pyri (nom. inval.)]